MTNVDKAVRITPQSAVKDRPTCAGGGVNEQQHLDSIPGDTYITFADFHI